MLLELLDQMFERMFRIGDCAGVHVGEAFERDVAPVRSGLSHRPCSPPADQGD